MITDQPKPLPDTFRSLARHLEYDEDEAAFEEKVRKVANSSVQQPAPDLKPE